MNIPDPIKMIKTTKLIDQLQPIFSRFESKEVLLPTLSQLSYLPTPSLNNIIKVPSSQLESLKQTTQSKLSQITSLKQKVNNLQMTLQVTDITLNQYKSRCKQLMLTSQQLYKLSMKQQQDYKILQEKYRELSKKYQEEYLNFKPNYKQYDFKENIEHVMKRQCWAQTDYWIPKLEISKTLITQQSLDSRTEADKRVEQVSSKLQNYLESISTEVNNSLSNIKSQELSLKDIVEKNSELNKQNLKLKQDVQQFDIDKEKFRVWKETVEQRMTELMKLADAPSGMTMDSTETIIEEYQPRSDIEMKEENKFMRNQIKRLRDVIIRIELEAQAEKLRLKIASTQSGSIEPGEIHQQTDGVEDDSLSLEKTIKTLAELSSKLKIVSNYLLSSESEIK